MMKDGCDMCKIPLLTIIGPTASGKTSFAVEVAKKYNGEVVSADSMQIYKGMDIATAKPTEQEMCGISHHMLSIVAPEERFSVADYVDMAKACIADIRSRGKLPVLAGGTGLYVSSLLDNLTFVESKVDHQLREELKKRAELHGSQDLLDELAKVDPETAAALHPNNLGRIIRALEIYYLDGITMTQQRELSRQTPSPYNPCIIGLDAVERQYLYNRIDARVDIMLGNGLLNEASEFLRLPTSSTAKQAIGYKELSKYFAGEIPLEDAVAKLKMETRRYAKRQLTWFRKMQGVNWIYIDQYDNSLAIIDSASKIIDAWLNGGETGYE